MFVVESWNGSIVVEFLDDALRIGNFSEYYGNDDLRLLNHAKSYFPQVLRDACHRIYAADAPDCWQGARFEHLAS